ncbi:MAG: hypothetical protein HEQ13_01395 [Dolichospermum sp. DEX189]|nr:hypothetical protein [Dolichospermum sp. DEX189]
MIPEFSVELGNREQGTGNREEGFQYVPSSVQKSNRSPIFMTIGKRNIFPF